MNNEIKVGAQWHFCIVLFRTRMWYCHNDMDARRIVLRVHTNFDFIIVVAWWRYRSNRMHNLFRFYFHFHSISHWFIHSLYFVYPISFFLRLCLYFTMHRSTCDTIQCNEWTSKTETAQWNGLWYRASCLKTLKFQHITITMSIEVSVCRNTTVVIF